MSIKLNSSNRFRSTSAANELLYHRFHELGDLEHVPIQSYLATIDVSAGARLAASLHRSALGFDVDLVTPLVRKLDMDSDTGRQYLSEELYRSVSGTGLAWLDEAEAEQSSKIGAYSIMLPYQERREQVLTYFHQRPVTADITTLELAVERVRTTLPTDLRAVPLLEAYERMPRGTNLGAPFFTSDERYRPLVYQMAQDVAAHGFPLEDEPSVLYWRGQPKGPGQIPKQRSVWGTPHYQGLIASMLQISFLNATKLDPTFVAWTTIDNINLEVTRLLRTAKQPILSIDFSGYDASIPGMLIDYAFELFKGCFQPTAWHLVDYAKYNFKYATLATPEGILGGKQGGVPSGDPNTNLMDGLIQRIIIEYCALRMRNRVKDHFVQGDDGLISWERPFSLDDLVGYAHELGVVVSDDKGLVNPTRVHFLQNYHSLDYVVDSLTVGVRPLMRILNGMLSYEHMVDGWNGFDDTLRWWQQAENGKYHPRFNSIARFLYDHDDYSKLAWPMVVHHAGGYEQFEKVTKQTAFPYGRQSIRGLSRFRIVQELEMLRGQSM